MSHTVLNAKNHEKEAEIIAMAGKKGAVTIATNMAGRGTDIKLGEGVTALGGLHVIGTERNESKRIDDQLRGRAGLQGDPGSSRFHLSLEDDLLRVSGKELISGIVAKLGTKDGEPIEHHLIRDAFDKAQSKVESRNLGIRKQLLGYDETINQQREEIYRRRREAMGGGSLRDSIVDMIHERAEEIARIHADEAAFPEEWDWQGLEEMVFKQFNLHLSEPDRDTMNAMDREILTQFIYLPALGLYEEKEAMIGERDLRQMERVVALETIDRLWADHLLTMDHLRTSLGHRRHPRKSPLAVYREESAHVFQDMVGRIKEETIRALLRTPLPESNSNNKQLNEQRMVPSGQNTREGEEKPVK